MALQFAASTRNALLDAIETEIGASAVLKFFTGSMPANVAASRTGTVVATLSLPSDWMAAASSGSKAKSGTWQDTSADATGTIGYFTVFASDGTTAKIQGTCTVSGGGGDMVLDSLSVTSGQTITVNTFTLTAPGA